MNMDSAPLPRLLAAVCDCGHPPTETTGIGTGYATDLAGRTMCYPCADSAQAAEVAASKPGDKFCAYVSSDGRTVTTWTGGVLMRSVLFGAAHPWSRRSWHETRHYMTAVDVDGRVWSGVGAEGMYAVLRLTKRTETKR